MAEIRQYILALLATTFLLLPSVALVTPLNGGGYVQQPTTTSKIHTLNSSSFLYPDSLTFDPANNNIYVANYYNNNLTVINGVTGNITGTIGNVQNATGVRYDPYNGYLVVTNIASLYNLPHYYTSILDPQTDKIIHRFNNTKVAFNTINGDFYLASRSTIEVVSANNWSVTGTINVNAHIAEIVFDSYLNTLLVSTFAVNNTLISLNVTANYQKTSYEFGNTASPLPPVLFTEVNSPLVFYTLDNGKFSGYTLNLQTGKTLWAASDTYFPYSPIVAYYPQYDALAIPQDQPSMVSLYNAQNGKLISNISLIPTISYPTAICYNPAGSDLYASFIYQTGGYIPNGSGRSVTQNFVYSISYEPPSPANNVLLYVIAAVISGTAVIAAILAYRRKLKHRGFH